MNAVLTGDLVNSTTLSATIRQQVIKGVEQEILKSIPKRRFQEEEIFYRGDSLQIVLNDCSSALELGIQLRMITKIKSHKDSDLRFAIGIGTIDPFETKMNTSDGEAFRYSGRTLEQMEEERMQVKSANEKVTKSINTALILTDTIISSWSIEVCEAVYYTIKGYTQKEVASLLHISQPAVHKRLKTGGYTSISQLIMFYKEAIKWI